MQVHRMEQMPEEKEFLYNPRFLEGIRGKILSNARVVIDEGDTIIKIWINPSMFTEIDHTLSIMSKIHPDLILEHYQGEQKWIRMRKIDYEHSSTRSYEENIKEYIKLREIRSIRVSSNSVLVKDDMSPNNIVWQKSDGKPYLLDWDRMDKCHIKEEKDYYRRWLCDKRWQEIYGSYYELADIFEKLWSMDLTKFEW